ncbi:MAG: NAD(P)-binding domain-containing protein [Pseudomonadota bacterium]
MMNQANQAAIKNVCIIGCGSSGMPAIKAMVDNNISFDCFEAGNDVGGNWTINNSNGMSAAYESLRINTSRQMMAYADYPMPEHFPDYPDHRLIAQYFNDYMDAFNLREYVQFNTVVERCERDSTGLWSVTLSSGDTRCYLNLVVANGHHWDPQWPQPPLPGDFNGLVMHSHSYISPYDPIDLTNKNIVILGMGNSAMDIACELSQQSLDNTVYLGVRTTAWVLPRYLFGKPLDQQARTLLPWRIMTRITEALMRLTHGSPQSHGLAKPKHRALQTHPTISQHIYDKLDNGEVIAKPSISELNGNRVRFSDGSEVDADVIIYATGYKVNFPFFDPGFISAPGNDLPLWQRLVKPGVDNLFFIGLMQPLGAVMPLAEQQAKLVAEVINGNLQLPPLEEMLDDMAQERVAMHTRYLDSSRHTMQVDGPAYRKLLVKTKEQAKRRATTPAPVLNRVGLSATKKTRRKVSNSPMPSVRVHAQDRKKALSETSETAMEES